MRGFRIRNSNQTLKRPVKKVNRFQKEKKPKSHLRYTEGPPSQRKGTLLSTTIEEHLLKFGYLDAFDTYIVEVAEKNLNNSKKAKVEELTLSELKKGIKNVYLKI